VSPVDTRTVTVRALGIVSLLVALAIGGWIFFAQARSTGPTSDLGKRAEHQAKAQAGAANFRLAVPVLQAHYAENGTYAGAGLPPNYGVTLVRADASSYCLQAGTGTSVQHVVGPGGSAAAGPC
jgi:hypothetical protein